MKNLLESEPHREALIAARDGVLVLTKIDAQIYREIETNHPDWIIISYDKLTGDKVGDVPYFIAETTIAGARAIDAWRPANYSSPEEEVTRG